MAYLRIFGPTFSHTKGTRVTPPPAKFGARAGLRARGTPRPGEALAIALPACHHRGRAGVRVLHQAGPGLARSLQERTATAECCAGRPCLARSPSVPSTRTRCPRVIARAITVGPPARRGPGPVSRRSLSFRAYGFAR